MFGSANDDAFFIAMGALRARSGNDLLRIGRDDFIAVAEGMGKRGRERLLDHLVTAAIIADCNRLIAATEAFGRENTPPARLVADWAISIGADSYRLAELAASLEAPVRLVTAYLRGGRLGVAEAIAISDVAAAYSGDRSISNRWINKAVEREIDHYTDIVKRQRSRTGLWRRLWRGFRAGSPVCL